MTFAGLDTKSRINHIILQGIWSKLLYIIDCEIEHTKRLSFLNLMDDIDTERESLWEAYLTS